MALDRAIFESPSVQLGVFRCSVDDARFHDSGPTNTFCFVFPRTSVVIEHCESRPFVADSTVVTLYNRGQAYRRRAVSNHGDRSDWFAVSENIVRDAVAMYDAPARDATRPIRFTHVPCDSALYRRQRELFVAVSERQPVEPLEVEERVIGFFGELLRGAYRRHHDTRSSSTDVVHAAQKILGRAFNTPLRLSDVASAVDCSVFHLCRAFRRRTGMTLHAYREQLRLRAAIGLLQESTDLTDVALELGYSSHSHFTARFRGAFGATPSTVRETLRYTMSLH